jgi:NAD+ kinase
MKRALAISPTPEAQAAGAALLAEGGWVDLHEAEQVVALGGDGYMLQLLHQMLEADLHMPVFGMNLGTFGFLMNEWRGQNLQALEARLAKAKAFRVSPLNMEATSVSGEITREPAINEVSLLRETRQTAHIEVRINGRTVLPELVGDGVLVATPAGSTAYNRSANGPILPLGSKQLALTPISPFRPRRWRGAIIPESTLVEFLVLDAAKRPVSAVADQYEVRDIARVAVSIDTERSLTLLFDPEHALDERITMEQFMV